jgi:hypothetical protein
MHRLIVDSLCADSKEPRRVACSGPQGGGGSSSSSSRLMLLSLSSPSKTSR